MKGQEYIDTQTKLITAGRLVEELDINEFLRSISKAEALAPMLDPTLYRKAQANLHGIRRLAEALLPVQVAYRELKGAIIETQAMGFMTKEKGEPTNESKSESNE